MAINNLRFHSRNLFIFITVFIALTLIFSYGMGNVAAANPGDTIYVNGSSGNDTWDGQSIIYNGTSGPKQTITNATQTITNNGTIYIASGTYNESNIQIITNMTIIGENQQNTIIDAQGNSNIFIVAPGDRINLTLINLTLQNGKTIGSGGAIDNEGNDAILMITNVTFNNNTAQFGGAIHNGGTLTETNNTFNNNIAQFGGGAIHNIGMLTETNNTFNNNIAQFGGGAIDNGGTLTETNITFNNNTAPYGGAIDNDDTLTETKDTLNNNVALYGGAIDNGGMLTETNDTFNNCTADDGGAIYNTNTLTETNCIFNNNTADDGGAIYNAGTLTVANSTFTNNTAPCGGAISNDFTLNVTNNTFMNNTAVLGGFIFSEGTANSVVEFNRILGNSKNDILCLSGNIDANNNWWGSNSDPSNYVCGYVNLTSWLVLTINAVPNIIGNNCNSTINVDLLHTNNGTIESSSIPDGLSVTFETNLGTISSSSSIINGHAQSTLSSGVNPGVATVSTTVDNQLVTTSVNVKDTIAPTVDIKSPLNGKYVYGIVPINISSTDNVGVTKIVFTLNGNNYTETNGTTDWSYNWNTTELTDGVYNITVTAYDAANNSQNQTISVNVDNTIPTANANVKGGVYNTNKVVTLIMSEPGNIYYTLNGTTPTNKSTLYTKTITITSTSTLKYLAIDLAGNKSVTYVQNYVIDKIAPKIVKTNPKYNAINIPLTTPLTITFSENILKGVTYNDIYIKNTNTGKLVQITKIMSKNTLTIKTTKSRLHNDNYIIYIPKDAFKDLAGNQTVPYTIKFKTG